MPVINAEERTDLQNCMHQIISSLFADEESTVYKGLHRVGI